MKIALAVGLLAVIFNLAVTIGLVRNEAYQRQQVFFQLVIIWLVPIFGAALCWYMLREDQRSKKEIESSGNEYAESMYNALNNEHTGHHGNADGSH